MGLILKSAEPEAQRVVIDTDGGDRVRLSARVLQVVWVADSSAVQYRTFVERVDCELNSLFIDEEVVVWVLGSCIRGAWGALR